MTATSLNSTRRVHETFFPAGNTLTRETGHRLILHLGVAAQKLEEVTSRCKREVAISELIVDLVTIPETEVEVTADYVEEDIWEEDRGGGDSVKTLDVEEAIIGNTNNRGDEGTVR